MDLKKDFLSELYNNYTPAVDNQYLVQIFYNGFGNETTFSEFSLRDYIELHAVGIKFNGESLQLKRNEVTKKFQVQSSAYTRQDELTITWRESDSWKIKKFHELWLANFYNRESDTYCCYKSKEEAENALTCNFKICFPDSNDTGTEGSKDILAFYNVMPKTSGSIDLKWNTTGNIISHQVTYYVSDWCWEKS